MAQIVDYYSESNASDNTSSIVGQSFTGNGGVLNSVKFYLIKSNSPTGNLYVKVYAHSGTFGTSSVPTGSALATSDAVDASTISTSASLVTFSFSGANKITLTNATKYVVVIENTVSSSPNFIYTYRDGSSPSHAGNMSWYSGSWNYDADYDLCFYVYADSSSASLSPSASPSLSGSKSPSASLSPSASVSSSASISPSASASPSTVLTYDHGIKISKEGKDVKVTEPEDDVFTSKKGVLGKRSVDSFVISTDGDGHGNDLDTHSIGYVPITIVSVIAYDGTVVSVPGTHVSGWGADEVLEEVFNYYVGETTIGFTVYAHHYEPWQGGTDTPLASQEYTMSILYCFNEISTE